MDQDRLESLGAIPMPQEGYYVVHPENVLAVLTDALGSIDIHDSH